MTVLCGGAVVGILVSSLRPGQISGGPIGLGAWTAVPGDASFWRAVTCTLWVASGATVVSAFLGLGAAVLLRRIGFGRVLFGVPIAVPHRVVAALAVV